MLLGRENGQLSSVYPLLLRAGERRGKGGKCFRGLLSITEKGGTCTAFPPLFFAFELCVLAEGGGALDYLLHPQGRGRKDNPRRGEKFKSPFSRWRKAEGLGRLGRKKKGGKIEGGGGKRPFPICKKREHQKKKYVERLKIVARDQERGTGGGGGGKARTLLCRLRGRGGVPTCLYLAKGEV